MRLSPLAPTARQAAKAMRPRSGAASGMNLTVDARAAASVRSSPRFRDSTTKRSVSRSRSRAGGFALIEVLLALAILALTASVVLPRVPGEPGRGALYAKTHEVAGMARQARNAAIRMRQEVSFGYNVANHTLTSADATNVVGFPDSVAVNLTRSRGGRPESIRAIRFFPSGHSSGGNIALRRDNFGYEVRIDGVTGRISISGDSALP
jgi:general secretion pathway protein H